MSSLLAIRRLAIFALASVALDCTMDRGWADELAAGHRHSDGTLPDLDVEADSVCLLQESVQLFQRKLPCREDADANIEMESDTACLVEARKNTNRIKTVGIAIIGFGLLRLDHEAASAIWLAM
mmetsp:Transcript_103870/g.294268  ORF Transcript_103870/g.294268 Transcript_103870/m.294268 type:complete len:124 (-) Transcript_103870:166-537(-)